MISLQTKESFQNRHIGSSETGLSDMLNEIGVGSLNELIDKTVPPAIRLKNALNLPEPKSEQQFLKEFKQLMSKNQLFRTYIGMGYYNTITPNVVLRNILENPGWYTAYTPYQAEIAQGRLEMLINYQTLVTNLSGMDIANASLLDEATAAGEAMTLLYAARKGSRRDANTLLVSEDCFPQTIDVLTSRSIPVGINLIIKKVNASDLQNQDVFGVLLQSPDRHGEIHDFSSFCSEAHQSDVSVCVASDLMALMLTKSPGEMGADLVIGSSQRFGVPLGFGGPHAAFFAGKDEFKRLFPGRIIGVSQDAQGDPAIRMALQTREQHIRREKATSNICTAQVLLSVMAAAYAVYHGPHGLTNIASRIHGLAVSLDEALKSIGFEQRNKAYFDTLCIDAGDQVDLLKSLAEQFHINFRYEKNLVYIALDETAEMKDIKDIFSVFCKLKGKGLLNMEEQVTSKIPNALRRNEMPLDFPVFHSYHSEHQMLRYLKRLENKDLSMVHSMISLGSCTMKLNATAEMIPVTWPELGQIHPFAPQGQWDGYKQMIQQLEKWLCEITGFTGVSLQPNSGAQGEYAGLMVIRAWHISRGQGHRNIALIPSSAHGTNPASAVMAGMKVIVVKCDDRGNIDVADLKAKAEEHANDLSCLMVTYPSTHGVFEESIIDICATIHQYGGQVYMDGANMNAQVGLTSPATIGADVCHLNLHKTFCIPHGGGGPGVGPIGVAAHLVPFLPGHAVVSIGTNQAISAVSAAPFGSASILPISYAYISMMGSVGLTNATKHAILNANYMKARLKKHYPILYTGSNGFCAHEFILDCRAFKHTVGIEVEDIAKRLMDYGFHAPTVSFPVAGTLMIEPTESESKDELDRFCDALISIRKEIEEIENGTADKANNVLKNAPHTAKVVLSDSWNRPYAREKAAYPLAYVRDNKFWPTVGRVDNAFGDRNLICTCAPIEEYAS